MDRNDFFVHPNILPILEIILNDRTLPSNLKKNDSSKEDNGDTDIETNTEILNYIKNVSKGRVFTVVFTCFSCDW